MRAGRRVSVGCSRTSPVKTVRAGPSIARAGAVLDTRSAPPRSDDDGLRRESQLAARRRGRRPQRRCRRPASRRCRVRRCAAAGGPGPSDLHELDVDAVGERCGCLQQRQPSPRTSAVSTSSTNTTACGLPASPGVSSIGAARHRQPPRRRDAYFAHPVRTSSPASSSTGRGPASVSTRNRARARARARRRAGRGSAGRCRTSRRASRRRSTCAMRTGAVRREQHDQAVGADAEVAVGPAAGQLGAARQRHRRGIASTKM
jgi:hypothetical protein